MHVESSGNQLILNAINFVTQDSLSSADQELGLIHKLVSAIIFLKLKQPTLDAFLLEVDIKDLITDPNIGLMAMEIQDIVTTLMMIFIVPMVRTSISK
jgi:hypothetical protein